MPRISYDEYEKMLFDSFDEFEEKEMGTVEEFASLLWDATMSKSELFSKETREKKGYAKRILYKLTNGQALVRAETSYLERGIYII